MVKAVVIGVASTLYWAFVVVTTVILFYLTAVYLSWVFA